MNLWLLQFLDLIWHRNPPQVFYLAVVTYSVAATLFNKFQRLINCTGLNQIQRSREGRVACPAFQVIRGRRTQNERIKEMRQNRTFLPLNQIESYDNLNLANLKQLQA
ncbi:Hypothetical_protein [Hexamita inflata]|uniref:Hypothetical_protein n=1 Tax=Hexamita inflata TaxID=28002 RepID=A0AA86P8L5_9EUKA|nr:Hypothetical protein HINF_LOCUS21428 [Hexamita inflata]CAI9933788.1 Hypothetical protein HINF_LOCUS21433 [Hexamita inflata]CAI9933797.1 Hypothetical protein HINF_LOCUS21442 [Hexamita inflata]CAI9933803.1 Hypothetical protein HINF_LOCUS21448 [Hexamita inflata]CAI9933809.1 Hypothetical protein HINF_LOCUS21454 [Hexamita inflata]